MNELSEQERLDRVAAYVNAATTPDERTRRKGEMFGMAYGSSETLPRDVRAGFKLPAEKLVRGSFEEIEQRIAGVET